MKIIYHHVQFAADEPDRLPYLTKNNAMMKKNLFWLIFIFSFSCQFFISSCSNPANLARTESIQKTSAAADELLLATSELRKEINQKIESNPNSSSEDFIALVDQKTKEIEEVKTQIDNLAPSRSFDSNKKKNFDKIRTYQQRLSNLSREVSAIHKSFEKELDKKLKSDVYFDTGSSIISKTGEEELKKIIANDFNTLITEWKNEEAYGNKPMKVKIKIIGYADLQGSPNIELRQNKNLAISKKRAESVKNIVGLYLEELKKKHQIQIQIEFEGKGEEAPPKLTDISLINNPDRRVCYISGYVIPVF